MSMSVPVVAAIGFISACSMAMRSSAANSGLLGVVQADADDELVDEPAGARDDVGVPERHGVERAGIKADAFHGLELGSLRLQDRLVLSRAYGRVQLLTASP